MLLLTCAFVLGFLCQTRSQRIWPLNPNKAAVFNHQPRRPVAEPSHLHPVFLQAPSQNEFRKAELHFDEGQRRKLQLKIHLPKDFPHLNSFQPISDSNRNQVPPVIYGFIPILSDDNEEDRRIITNSEIDRNRNTPNTFREFSQDFNAKQRTEHVQNHNSFNSRDNFKEPEFKQHGNNRPLHPPSQNSYTASNISPNSQVNNQFESNLNTNKNHFPIENDRFNVHQQQEQENTQHNSGQIYRENRVNGNVDYHQKKLEDSRQENPSNHYEKILEHESNGFAHADSHNIQIPNKIPHTAEPVVIPLNDISPLNLEVTDHSIVNLHDNDKGSVFIPTVPIPDTPENQDKKLFLVFKAPTMVTTERPASAPFSVKQRNNLNTDKIDEKAISSLSNGNKFGNSPNKVSSDYHINENRDNLNSQFNREVFPTNTQLQYQNDGLNYGTLSDNTETFHHSPSKDAEIPFHQIAESNHDNKQSFHSYSRTVQETQYLPSSQNRDALPTNTQLSYQQGDENHQILKGDTGPFHHLPVKDTELPNHQTAESIHDNKRSLYSSLAISQITHFLGGSMPKVSIRRKNIFSPTQKYLNKNIKLSHQPLVTEQSNVQQGTGSNRDNKPSVHLPFQTEIQKTQQLHSPPKREEATDKQLSHQEIDANHQALNDNREYFHHSSPNEREKSIHQTVENNRDNIPFINSPAQNTQNLQPLLNKEAISTDMQISSQQINPNHRTVNDNKNDAFHPSSSKDIEASHLETKNNPNNKLSLHAPLHINMQTAIFPSGPQEKVSKHKENSFPLNQKYSNITTNSQLLDSLLPKETQDSIRPQSDMDVKGEYQLFEPFFARANRTLHPNPPSAHAISGFQGNSLLFPSASPSIAQISYAQSSLQKKVPKNNFTNPVIYFSIGVPNSKSRQETNLKNTQPKILKEPKFPGKSEASLQRRPVEDRVIIPGRPGSEYPNYSTIPYTNFECGNMKGPGFYADLETGCQVFHNCDVGMSKHSFMCPNGTIFHQELVICDWWYNVRCEDSPRYYDLFPQGVDGPSIQ